MAHHEDCPVCGRHFDNLEYLCLHWAKKHTKPLLVCPLCHKFLHQQPDGWRAHYAKCALLGSEVHGSFTAIWLAAELGL